MDLEVSKSVQCLPKIKNVLLKYANSAANSLHGPKSSIVDSTPMSMMMKHGHEFNHNSNVSHHRTNGNHHHHHNNNSHHSSSHGHVHHKKRDVSSLSSSSPSDYSSSSSTSSSTHHQSTSRGGESLGKGGLNHSSSSSALTRDVILRPAHNKTMPNKDCNPELGEINLMNGSTGQSINHQHLMEFNRYYYEGLMKSFNNQCLFPFFPTAPPQLSLPPTQHGPPAPSDVPASQSGSSSLAMLDGHPVAIPSHVTYNLADAYKSLVMAGVSGQAHQLPLSENRYFPILAPADCSVNEVSETLLNDCVIPCFVIGGEKRLCLPKILISVLKDFTLGDINTVCDELQIYCSKCTPYQLAILKKMDLIPNSAPSCGLITKTDAERLVSALFDKHQPHLQFAVQQQNTASSSLSSAASSASTTTTTSRSSFNISRLTSPPVTGDKTTSREIENGNCSKSSSSESNAKNNTSDIKSSSKNVTGDSLASANLGDGGVMVPKMEGATKSNNGEASITIHHNCFGKCSGIYRPAMYTSQNAACIQCTTCGNVFSPQKFVCHTHKSRHSRTCHWGFESSNWRSYLVLSHGVTADTDTQSTEMLEHMKNKFRLMSNNPVKILHASPQPPCPPVSSLSPLSRKTSSSQDCHSLPLRHAKRFKSSVSPEPPSLTSNLRALLDIHNIDKSLQSKIMHEVEAIIDRVKN